MAVVGLHTLPHKHCLKQDLKLLPTGDVEKVNRSTFSLKTE